MTNLDLVNQSFLIETDFFFETKKGNIWKPFLRNSEGNQWKISHCLSYNCQLSLDLGTKKKKGWISLFKDRIQKVIELRTWERYSETNKKDGHHPINPKKNIPPKSHWHKKETKTSLLLSHHLLTYLELFKKNLQKNQKIQHQVFPCGHPPQYWLGPPKLSLRDRTGTRVFFEVWSYLTLHPQSSTSSLLLSQKNSLSSYLRIQ